MAKLNINIINPTIDLIRGLTEMPTDCKSYFTFDILTTAGADIVIDLAVTGDQASGKIDIDENESAINPGAVIVLPQGIGKVTITIDNPSPNYDGMNQIVTECNSVKVKVTDNTNVEQETAFLSRCNTGNCY